MSFPLQEQTCHSRTPSAQGRRTPMTRAASCLVQRHRRRCGRGAPQCTPPPNTPASTLAHLQRLEEGHWPGTQPRQPTELPPAGQCALGNQYVECTRAGDYVKARQGVCVWEEHEGDLPWESAWKHLVCCTNGPCHNRSSTTYGSRFSSMPFHAAFQCCMQAHSLLPSAAPVRRPSRRGARPRTRPPPHASGRHSWVHPCVQILFIQ